MKPDALELLRAVADGETPRAAGARIGVHPKRVASLCEKWQRKGWYEYGVCVDLGWLTPAGRRRATAGRWCQEKNAEEQS